MPTEFYIILVSFITLVISLIITELSWRPYVIWPILGIVSAPTLIITVMFSFTVPKSEYIKFPESISIAKTATAVHVESVVNGGKVFRTFSDAFTFNNIDNPNYMVQFRVYRNCWGSDITTKFELVEKK